MLPRGVPRRVARSTRTPAERVEADQARLHRAKRGIVLAFVVFLVGFGLSFLAARIESRALQVAAFAIGAFGVLLALITVLCTGMVILRSVLGRK
jgi:hypothetical protein